MILLELPYQILLAAMCLVELLWNQMIDKSQNNQDWYSSSQPREVIRNMFLYMFIWCWIGERGQGVGCRREGGYLFDHTYVIPTNTELS